MHIFPPNLIVKGRMEANMFVKAKPKHFHVISICAPGCPGLENPSHAKTHQSFTFDDTVKTDSDRLQAIDLKQANGILHTFARTNNEPTIIHCEGGISRSTAVTLGILYLTAVKTRVPQPHKPAATQLLELRKIAQPNKLVLHRILQAGLNPQADPTPVVEALLCEFKSQQEAFVGQQLIA